MRRIQATVDAVARRLPTCHGPLMARSGRLVWIKSVLAGPYLHHDSGRPAALGKKGNRCNMQALPLDRERRIHPRKDLGGLGVPDLYFTEIALQARWLWLRHTDEQRAWSELPITVSSDVQAFFTAFTYTIVGNGRTTNFWSGSWLQGQAISDLAPTLTSFVSRRHIRDTTVAAALHNNTWIKQLAGGLTVPAVVEY